MAASLCGAKHATVCAFASFNSKSFGVSQVHWKNSSTVIRYHCSFSFIFLPPFHEFPIFAHSPIRNIFIPLLVLFLFIIFSPNTNSFLVLEIHCHPPIAFRYNLLQQIEILKPYHKETTEILRELLWHSRTNKEKEMMQGSSQETDNGNLPNIS